MLLSGGTSAVILLAVFCGTCRASAVEGAPKILSMNVEVPDGTSRPIDLTVNNPTDRAVRLEVQLQRFVNDKGLTAQGEDCDITTTCDIYLSAFLDTETPTARWPGSATFTTFNRIMSTNNMNTFDVDKIVSREFCNVTSTPVSTLRVEALDQDTFTPDDIVEQFDCGPLPSIDMLTFVTEPNAEVDSTWNVVACRGLLQGGKVQLTVGYRATLVPSATCVILSPIITEELAKVL